MRTPRTSSIPRCHTGCFSTRSMTMAASSCAGWRPPGSSWNLGRRCSGATLSRRPVPPASVMAATAFVHTGGDINDSSTYRTGLSWLHSVASDRTTFTATNDTFDIFNGRVNTLIWDAVYKWAPNGNPVDTNFKLQGEFFANQNSGQFNSIPYNGWQTGFYAQAVYQFMPRWRFGVRYDQLHGNQQTGDLAG